MLRLYRGLLYLYPSDYRQEFGAEMAAVFLQAQSDTEGAGFATRTIFRVREISGLLTGALRGHLRRVFGFNDWIPFRRFDMSAQFRFPRSTVFLMCVILAGVVLTIEKAKAIQVKYGAAQMSIWPALPWSLVLMLALVGVTVAAAWGILFAMRRSGMHRLDHLHGTPEQR
jgi:hypothetical protein